VALATLPPFSHAPDSERRREVETQTGTCMRLRVWRRPCRRAPALHCLVSWARTRTDPLSCWACFLKRLAVAGPVVADRGLVLDQLSWESLCGVPWPLLYSLNIGIRRLLLEFLPKLWG
jgi:hypothetical protein